MFIINIYRILFKISAAPFHFWSPDGFTMVIPTIITTFVAIIAKNINISFNIHIVHYTNNIYISIEYYWTISILFFFFFFFFFIFFFLLISSLLSLVIGTVLGLNSIRIKRLYAYSTISH